MKSLRELRTELLNVRLGAVTNSLWSIGATLENRALAAINDAINTYEFTVRDVYTSSPLNVRTFALPQNVERVPKVDYIDTSGGGRVFPMHNIDFNPTGRTNILHVNITTLPSNSGYLEVHYESRLRVFPEDVFLSGPVQSSIQEITPVSGVPSLDWDSPGYLELTDYSYGTGVKEVVRYNSTNSTAFCALERGVRCTPVYFTGTVRVSTILPVDDKALSVIMPAAEATMYNYWVGHRALYDQYSAMAGVTQLELADIVAMVRILDDRADQRYKRIKTPPTPGRLRRR